MKYFICIMLTALMWCLVMGEPYSHLLSSMGFWCVVTFASLAFVGVMEWSSSNKSWISTAIVSLLIAAYIISVCLLIFSPHFREMALNAIDMQDYADRFNAASITWWQLVLASVLEFVIFSICGIKMSDKPHEESRT